MPFPLCCPGRCCYLLIDLFGMREGSSPGAGEGMYPAAPVNLKWERQVSFTNPGGVKTLAPRGQLVDLIHNLMPSELLASQGHLIPKHHLFNGHPVEN